MTAQEKVKLSDLIDRVDPVKFLYASRLVDMLNSVSPSTNYGYLLIQKFIYSHVCTYKSDIISLNTEKALCSLVYDTDIGKFLSESRWHRDVAGLLFKIIRSVPDDVRMLFYYLVESGYPEDFSDIAELEKVCHQLGKTYASMIGPYDYAEKFVKKIKVFVSHNMSNVDENSIKKLRVDACKYVTIKLKDLGRLDETTGVQIIDNYTHPDAPEDAGRLWHLGRSIQQLQQAEYIYFVPEFSDSRGCQVERKIAELYEIPILE